MGQRHSLLSQLHQPLASLSLTATLKDSGCQRLRGMLVYQLRRRAVWEFDHLRKKDGKMEVVFSIYSPSFPPIAAARGTRVFLKQAEQSFQLSS